MIGPISNGECIIACKQPQPAYVDGPSVVIPVSAVMRVSENRHANRHLRQVVHPLNLEPPLTSCPRRKFVPRLTSYPENSRSQFVHSQNLRPQSLNFQLSENVHPFTDSTLGKPIVLPRYD